MNQLITTNGSHQSSGVAWENTPAGILYAIQSREKALRILPKIYKQAKTHEEKLLHRATILSVLHDLHVNWERLWDQDIRVHEVWEEEDR